MAAMFPGGTGHHTGIGPIQSPPSTNGGGGYLLLGTSSQQRQGDANGLQPSLSPNSTPGLQMPGTPATPPIVNINLDDRNMFLNGMGRLMAPGLEKLGLDAGQIENEQQAMAWKGMQGGILAEMFPTMDRQMTGYGAMHANNGQGFNNAAAAVAAQVQAQENLARLQQQQNQSQVQQSKQTGIQQFHPPPHMMAQTQQEMSRAFPNHGYMPPQSPPPSNNFSLPPGPRPRPVGGDDSSPGYTPDIPATSNSIHTEEKDDLVIGSWNDECDKEGSRQLPGVHLPSNGHPPVGILQNLSKPPPRPPMDNMFGGTFHVPQGRGGQIWGQGEFKRGGIDVRGRGRGSTQEMVGKLEEKEESDDNGKVGRGGRGARGGSQQSRGVASARGRPSLDHTQEKAAGKNAAIEETKAMMAKMRLEEKEMMEKYKKEKGIIDEEEPKLEQADAGQPGAYKPREKRGRDDRKDGQRGRGGRGRGRGGVMQPHMQGVGPMSGPMFGMSHGPGDFRTPPFPGLEGFLPHQALQHFPPGFPPNFAPGFPPGIYPGGFPGVMRGRGGFPRGARGFPAGFPPRCFPPPMIGLRGGRGRGGYQGSGRGKDFRGGGGNGLLGDPGGDENPLLSAIESNKADSVEALPTPAIEQDDQQSKNLFSGQGEPMGQLALFAEADLRGRLSDQLVRGETECMVCLDRVKQQHATWDCKNCYQIFHIHCIKKWAKTAVAESGGWRCPGCQSVSSCVPKEYLCFCRKLKDPEWNRNECLVPHSCGEVCGRALGAGVNCPHKCLDLCHAGPCPPCAGMVMFDCPCGKEKRRIKCGEEFLCEGVCEKPLNCGVHLCPDTCHGGPCYDCHNALEQACYCGKGVREVVCSLDTAGIDEYSCAEVCERTLNCENHQCGQLCHPDSCKPCQLTPEKVTTCPCGKTSLEKLYERDGVPPRESCLDPIPECGMTCGKGLPCGPPATPHTCSASCHMGPCPACPHSTSIRCRCGNMDQEILCSELTTRADDARCQKRCQKKRSCGRHKCGETCCIRVEHTCPLVCGKLMTCTQHRCEDECHMGNCSNCPRVSFDELSCHCGSSIIYPPIACGTKPPECQDICNREHGCVHSVTHKCHSEDNCPPCTQLTTKLCFGEHEERKNVACLVEGISCGKACGKEAPCEQHNCIRICHAGTCLSPGASCTQSCTTQRICGHTCNTPCHSGTCPETACPTQVRVTCECGFRQATIPCSENSYSRVTTSLLASQMADVQAGNSVNLGELVKKDKKLECNEDCHQLERNKRVALALQIRNPELSSRVMPRYSEFMKAWAKKDPTLCTLIHTKLSELVKLSKESKQKSRAYSFDCMNREKRQLVHEFAEHFGCESESYDAEPKRNVVATALCDKSWLPAISLLEFAAKQKRAPPPGPVSSGGPIKPTFTTLTVQAGKVSEGAEVTKKIDWFD